MTKNAATQNASKEPKRKQPKPRCKNCGDETSFPENADPRREQRGWCVPCWRQAKNFVPYDRPARDGATGHWRGENRTIYDSKRAPWATHGPAREED